MAKLRIVRTDGSDSTHQITPAVEFAFEAFAKKGLHKAFREEELQTMVYWLAHEITKRSGEPVDAKFENFIATLKNVEVLDSDPLL